MMKRHLFWLSLTGAIVLLGCEEFGPTGVPVDPSAVSGQRSASSGGSSASPLPGQSELSYPIVDTGQTGCYGDYSAITCAAPGAAYYGQDGQVQGLQPAYRDNGDGTVADLNTGLMWVAEHGEKVTWTDAMNGAGALDLAGYDDWRMPTIKELYSLIDFNGGSSFSEANSVPFIDTAYFSFVYGDESAGERIIDAQYWSATEYVGTTMNGSHTVFGVNFADGRIKGYPAGQGVHGLKITFVKYVRGGIGYGENSFHDNGDGTVSDLATGLMWQQGDSGEPIAWSEALEHCESLSSAGHDDWRLPNAKELQSIVDYTRAPGVTGDAAIDPVFEVSNIESYYWTSTSHLEGPEEHKGAHAVYVCFGRAWGNMESPPGSGSYQHMDVHGAGAQRSDPKVGDPNDYPNGFGPQGDDIRIYNYARCVRDGRSEAASSEQTSPPESGPGPESRPEGEGEGKGEDEGQPSCPPGERCGQDGPAGPSGQPPRPPRPPRR